MDGEGIAGEVDSSLYPAAVLIDELRSDNLHRRLNSIKNLGTIAAALGVQRTCEELLPFLAEECTDDDDELLFELAEQLEAGVPWVGGSANAHALLGPLEQLCSAEEVAVRDRAGQAIRQLALKVNSMDHIYELICRLAVHDWFTARMAACSIFPAALKKVSEVKRRDDLLRTYFRLCGDDTTMTRRSAAHALGDIAQVLEGDSMMKDIIEVFEKLAKDEQDSVRILAISNCIVLGKLTGNLASYPQVFSVVTACGEDKSWRVRYMVADHAQQLCEVFESQVKSSILPLFLKLLQDQEAEVRAIAAARLASVAALHPKKEFLDSLLPAIEKLTMPKELSTPVRISLAGSVLNLASIFGAKLTTEHLLGIYKTLIKDESADVRLKLISSFGDLSSIVGSDAVLSALLPAIIESAQDKQWRVRLAVLDSMPSLAKSLGEVRFTAELLSLFMSWLADEVYAVRASAAKNYKQLVEVFGISWSESRVIPQLQSMAAHKNYLYRVSAIPCVGMLAEVINSPVIEKSMMPILVKAASDPVPNVRLNAAKTLKMMHKNCSCFPTDKFIPCLQKLSTDEDPDVTFFATACLTQMRVSG
jgi:serine/threonine-protein phosphatase 2A regulatory subunit A